MLKEIGSNFWLNVDNFYSKEKKISLDYLDVNISDIAFLSTGRSAISYVLEHIQVLEKRKIALLPSFTCNSVIEPFINSGFHVQFYQIDKDLLCSENTLIDAIEMYHPSVVLVHGYFGFNTLESIKAVIKKIQKTTDITVIEDVTQTIYSSFGHVEADYYICSLRKWTSLPDGGFAISTKKPFLYKPDRIDEILLGTKLKAFHTKYLYMVKNVGGKDAYLHLFEEAEQILCSQKSIFAMNSFSEVIQANLDLDFLRNTRRENFKVLSELLVGVEFIKPLFNYIPDNVTPLYFPIYVKGDRRELQSHLAKNNVFASVVWPKPEHAENLLFKDVEWIYKHILAIPCDQRYTNEEMIYMADKIKNCNMNKVE